MTRDEIVAYGRRLYLKKMGRGATLREDQPVPTAPRVTVEDFESLKGMLGRELTQDDREALAEGFSHPFGSRKNSG